MLTPRHLTAVLGLSAALGLAAGCESNHANHGGTKSTAKAGDDCCADGACDMKPTTAPSTKPVAAASTRPVAAGRMQPAEVNATAVVAAVTAAEPPKPAAPAAAPATAPSVAATTQPAAPASQPAAAAEAGWRDLFDGKAIKDPWKVSEFAGHGEVEVKDGVLVLPSGESLTGVTYTGELPKVDYEVEVVAKRVDGVDFFCGITFPVNDTYASLIVGGWGGTVVGISSIDDEDAAHNDTTKYKSFKLDRWYTVRVRVQAERLQAWVDGEQLVDANIKGKKVATRGDINEGKPLGVAGYQTTAAVKSIRIRKL